MPSHPLRLGTRSSPLARWQAEWVAARLQEHGVEVELVWISTQGDVRTGSLASFGGVGVFTKEIQRALLAGEIDLAVHSLKDLPTEKVEGLTLAAVPPRESPRDALIANDANLTFETLPKGARIGTGSLRRRACLLHARPDLVMEEIRGNVDTRIRKLTDGQYDAIILAEAGLSRLGLAAKVSQFLGAPLILPAPGQGALGIEARSDAAASLAALAPLNDVAARAAVIAERALLAELRAGCLAPVGAWGRLGAQGELLLDAAVLSPDGRQRIDASGLAAAAEAESLGQRLAADLIARGARELIVAAREPRQSEGL